MKNKKLYLAAIIGGALIVRMYSVTSPIADWHSWRQADTSAVTRNFVKFGFNPFIPRYDDISNVQSGLDNPAGYRFVEFPLYNSISYILYTIASPLYNSIEFWQRIVSIMTSLGTLYFIYLLVRKYVSESAALWSASFFAFLPYSIYYGRTILPEGLLLTASTGFLYFLSAWLDEKKPVRKYVLLALSTFFAASALLIKPIAGALLLPIMYLLFAHQKRSFQPITIGLFFLFIVISIIPLWWWRNWMQQFPEGIPAWDWLLNGDGIRFKGSFFYWIFAERIGKLMLGYYGLVFLVLGILSLKDNKYVWFFHSWGIAMLAYITIVATGNVKHDYYQIFILPIIAIYAGLGANFLFHHVSSVFPRFTTYLAGALLCIATVAFSWYQIRTYYWINNSAIVEAGKMADTLLPSDAKVIASYNGDTAFLYQTNRQGWPTGLEIPEKIHKGATHYVSVTPDDLEVEYVQANWPTLFQNERFVIVELQ